MYYYLSLGSNIHPEKNAVGIVTALLAQFNDLYLFPFIKTQPVNMETNNYFLNSLAIINSDLKKSGIKSILNHVEISLGRDRSDPHKSKKDRTADIDILGCELNFDTDFFLRFKESYIADCLSEEIPHINLSEFGLPDFNTASWIITRDNGKLMYLPVTQ